MRFDDRDLEGRRDIVRTTSSALSRALQPKKQAENIGSARALQEAMTKLDSRLAIRKAFVEPQRSDPNGFERIIGESNLLSINFLDRGRRAAAAACRIRVPADGGAWYGTAFLVGPRLLITNHHVLATPGEAGQAEAEFGYEHDIDGVLQEPVQFNLNPHEVFYTSAELDVAFVAVAPLSDGGVPLARYGRLPLIPIRGKVLPGEWVSIVQHPGGEPKQIVIKASQIAELKQSDVPDVDLDTFIHYTTDTEPGSSGSPVLNDQWQVVALHHKAVPDPASLEAPDTPPRYLANEGVRISAIFRHLESRRFTDLAAGLVLDRLDISLGLPPTGAPSGESVLEADRKPLPVKRWATAPGYDPEFLTTKIELGPIYAEALKEGLVAPLLKGADHELAYHHFSAVIQKERKFPLFTAVNIDGSRLKHPGERKDTWRRDARIADQYQPAGEFYEKNRGHDPVQFSRGHQVRLLDPCWGESVAESRINAEDTFHYTNAAPQVQKYNDIDWGNLEDYILDKAQSTSKRLTVFTGPIYRADDPWYGRDRKGGPWRIPLSFWKVAVLQKTENRVAAAAFVVGQPQYVTALYETKVFSGLKPYTVEEMRSKAIQTTIKVIEEESGLSFEAVREFDAHGSLESTRQIRWLSDMSDIVV